MGRRVAAFLLATIALAGCAGGDGENGLGDDTYEPHADGVTDEPVAPGTSFTFTNRVTGGPRHTSDHIGAHFWNTTQADPTAAISASKSCSHTGGELPGSFTVTCTVPVEPGTYYVRAHARITEEGKQHDWWGDEVAFVVGLPTGV